MNIADAHREFNIGSKVRVIDPSSYCYKLRGRIVREIFNGDASNPQHDCWEVLLCRDGKTYTAEFTCLLKDEQLANIQKKFIDIEHIREHDVEIGADTDGSKLFRKSNTSAFEAGDIIQITEKIDGANASVAYNKEDGKLEAFSRTNLLDGADGLRGFKAYVDAKLDPETFKQFPDLVVFGEWCVSHKIQYAKSWYNVWRVYDIWDKSSKRYMPQTFVKAFCAEHSLEYIHELYYGPFISWEHCRSFMHANTYGNAQEGIVIKNQTKLDDESIRAPKYLKIVDDSFKETMKAKAKTPISSEAKAQMDNAIALIASIATEARASKIILKLVDEGIVPRELTPRCMEAVMKNLPKRLWEDLLKEEKEVVEAAGEHASKACSMIAASLARKIIIGK